MSAQDVGLILGIFASLSVAAVALYRARPQKDLDEVTKLKVEQEVRRLQTNHDLRRTARVLRLEKYVDQDVVYHRKSSAYQAKLVELLEECIEGGLLPDGTHTHLGKPPRPPELPKVDFDEFDGDDEEE